LLAGENTFGTGAGEIGNGDDVIPLVLCLRLRHHRHAAKIGRGDD
jgi:hypothetical protein